MLGYTIYLFRAIVFPKEPYLETAPAKNLTAYGLLPVASMLEHLGFQQLIEETLTVKAGQPSHEYVSVRSGHGAGGPRRVFPLYHLRFVCARAMLTGVLALLA